MSAKPREEHRKQGSGSAPPHLDIIVPVFNEQAGLQAFANELTPVLNGLEYRWRVIFVDDGSSDRTPDILRGLALDEARITWIRLSRNFGYQAALTAGLEHADGDVIGTMDGDGEHPPALLPQMLALLESGYDIVLTVRKPSGGRKALGRLPQAAFYMLLNLLADTKVVPGVTDYRLLRRGAWQSLIGMRERHRYLRGMVAWMGFKSVILPFDPPARRQGGSRWTAARLFRLAGEAILSFSLVPLTIGLLIGLLFLLFAGIEAIYVITLWLIGWGGQIAPGWSSLMFVLLIVGSSLMITLAIVGIYAGLTYQEVKRRPVYLIEASSRESEGTPRRTENRPRRGRGPGSRTKGRR